LSLFWHTAAARLSTLAASASRRRRGSLPMGVKPSYRRSSLLCCMSLTAKAPNANKESVELQKRR